MTYNSSAETWGALAWSHVEEDLPRLRARVRLATLILVGSVFLFALIGPRVAPQMLWGLYGLKAGCLALCACLWWVSMRTTSQQVLTHTMMLTALLVVLFAALSSLLVGENWHATVFAGGVAIGAAALLPWGVRAQVYLAMGVAVCALLPVSVHPKGGWTWFLVVSLNPVLWSVVIAWQQERHRLEARRREESFHKNLSLLRLLAEQIHGVLWLNDTNGALIFLSPRFEDLWGKSRRLLEREPAGWLDSVHPDDRDRVTAWMRAGAATGALTCEYRLLGPNGRLRWIRDGLFPIARPEGGAWGVGRISIDITGEKQATSPRRMQGLARTIQAAVEEERKRLARELHDELGQELTGIKLLLGSVQQTLEASHPEASKRLQLCADEITKGMWAVHAMIHALRPPALDELGLVAALRSETEAFAKRAGIRCDLALPDVDLNLSDEQVTTVFRIAQEALTNVARHARASCVRLQLHGTPEHLQLCVEDDGQGIEAAREDFGLRGMRERAALLNGTLDVQSRAEGGTRIRLQIPRTPSLQLSVR